MSFLAFGKVEYYGVVLLDVAKAFDTVCVSGLTYKLT